jgi:hypothetical protein
MLVSKSQLKEATFQPGWEAAHTQAPLRHSWPAEALHVGPLPHRQVFVTPFVLLPPHPQVRQLLPTQKLPTEQQPLPQAVRFLLQQTDEDAPDGVLQ